MQVFISDLHLTDGTSGQTINSGAFRVFRDNLQILVNSILESAKVTDLKIVLLGDIFDVIRSTQWIDAGEDVRPWSKAGPEQNTVLRNIVKRILSGSENQKSLGYLADLRDFADRKGLGFELQYVIGNHDWLINRYADCRREVATALGLPKAATAPVFPSKLRDDAYRTIARHGDIYDAYNYAGDRDRSSIGDAVVVELLDRFPRAVEEPLAALVADKEITDDQKLEIVEYLRELDNIRPMFDAPSWILMIADKARVESVREVLEKTWQERVDAFCELSFLDQMRTDSLSNPCDQIRRLLHLSSHTPTRWLERLAKWVAGFRSRGPEVSLLESAFAEEEVCSGEADYVIYGHTHQHLIAPLDHVKLDNGDRDIIYFNTGTWRQTWNKAALDKINREFVGWQVLTYVAFYREEENNTETKRHSFEVWNGALG